MRTMQRGGVAAVAACAILGLLGTSTMAEDKPVVVIKTNLGEITVELEPEKAPKTVENFLKYVDDGFYDGTIFHRVVPGFVVQGGGMTPRGREKPTRDPIINESKNGLSNARGTIAMARTNDPNSATSQFYINLNDNKPLDTYGGGYAVFGKVTAGMEVVDKIGKVETDGNERPRENVIIESVKRKAGSESEKKE